jgi:hypothetical protein
MATVLQVQIARMLGLDVTGDADEVAAARIFDLVAPAIGDRPIRPSTDKQRAFAEALGVDVSLDSLRVASGRIQTTLRTRNLEAVARMGLVAGAIVILERNLEHDGARCCTREAAAVSSISEDGIVYFRGGTCYRAPASRLRLPTAEEIEALRVETLPFQFAPVFGWT